MATQSIPQEQDKPNGPVAAALIAGGLGAAAIGLLTTLAEASEPIKNALNWYNPVGPLIGKSLLGVIFFFVSWIVLYLIFRGKNVNFARATTVALILLAFGLLGTFPPFFEIFAAE
ncbi:MAG TPA: hypothetical protein VJG32_16900 [Anaerolineae bacterium]|nr:hypothetical protein [Anaerolineae bacterium]